MKKLIFAALAAAAGIYAEKKYNVTEHINNRLKGKKPLDVYYDIVLDKHKED